MASLIAYVPNDLHHHGMKVVECATDRLGAYQGCTATVAEQQKRKEPPPERLSNQAEMNK
jgi:hypothetical protein